MHIDVCNNLKSSTLYSKEYSFVDCDVTVGRVTLMTNSVFCLRLITQYCEIILTNNKILATINIVITFTIYYNNYIVYNVINEVRQRVVSKCISLQNIFNMSPSQQIIYPLKIAPGYIIINSGKSLFTMLIMWLFMVQPGAYLMAK